MNEIKIEVLNTFNSTMGLLDCTREMIRGLLKHKEISNKLFYEFIKDLLSIEINLRYGKTQVKFYDNYIDTISILELSYEEIDHIWNRLFKLDSW